jgi:anti-sigma factor RsiW
MTNSKKISESALQAYYDGELDESLKAEVESWLAENPEERAQFEDWDNQKLELKSIFDPILDEQIPPMLLRPINSLEPAWRRSKWLSAAAAILIFALGGVVGTALSGTGLINFREISQKSNWPEFASDAVGAHLIFAADKNRPVEITSQQREKLVGWLAKWLGKEIQPPDLSAAGYELIGGRLLPSGYWPAAQFMYQNSEGERLTLFIAKTNSGQEIDYNFWRKDKIGCYYWTEDQYGFALTGEADQKFLKSIAEKVYDHFEQHKL